MTMSEWLELSTGNHTSPTRALGPAKIVREPTRSRAGKEILLMLNRAFAVITRSPVITVRLGKVREGCLAAKVLAKLEMLMVSEARSQQG
jgi:hypothetical protein